MTCYFVQYTSIFWGCLVSYFMSCLPWYIFNYSLFSFCIHFYFLLVVHFRYPFTQASTTHFWGNFHIKVSGVLFMSPLWFGTAWGVTIIIFLAKCDRTLPSQKETDNYLLKLHTKCSHSTKQGCGTFYGLLTKLPWHFIILLLYYASSPHTQIVWQLLTLLSFSLGVLFLPKWACRWLWWGNSIGEKQWTHFQTRSWGSPEVWREANPLCAIFAWQIPSRVHELATHFHNRKQRGVILLLVTTFNKRYNFWIQNRIFMLQNF